MTALPSHHTSVPSPDPTADAGLPWPGLLALSITAFTTLMTETLPAGVLPAMSVDLHASAANIGMLVSCYAIAAAMGAIPLISLTRGLPRRPFLVGVLAATALANLVTALSSHYALTVAARIFAGLLAGVSWPLVVSYASRIALPRHTGRAIAIAMTGGTIALSLGIPGGAFLGEVIGWRATFILLALISLALIVWIFGTIPPLPGEHAHGRLRLLHVLQVPKLQIIFLGLGLTILCHYSLYTYVAPLAVAVHVGSSEAFFLFGVGAFAGITLVGRFVDEHLRGSAFASLTLAAFILVALGTGARFPWIFCPAMFLWGVSFGSAPTIFQTAANRLAGKSSEVTASILTTVYSIGIFGGGWLGGLCLETAGVRMVPWLSLIVIALALIVVGVAGRSCFPLLVREEPCSETLAA